MRVSRVFLCSLALACALAVGLPIAASATVPYPAPQHTGSDPYDYEDYAFVDDGDCSSGSNPMGPRDLPSNFDCKGDWKYTNYAARPGDSDFDPTVASNPAELGGVKGARVNKAWEITTGRPDTVIAVLDSGIRWDGRNSVTGRISDGELEELEGLRRKFFLNSGELPAPGPASCASPGFGGYDRNCDGIFNVADYEKADGCTENCVDDVNQNTLIDPEDLILSYSNGTDDDNNAYPDDISGWDFFEDDNDANDDVDYGHGTGESEDSTYEAEVDGRDGMCPNCMVLEMRVGDSFIADVNHFAEAVVYATDNGASVVQEALGTLNNSSFGQAAVDYAYDNGVVVVASAADESAAHHNYPSNYNHTMVVNSVTQFDETQAPRSYLYFNGCTNFGGHIHVAVPSSSCSSEATGRSAGYAGLVYSAARNAVARGQMTNYVDDDGRETGYPLSAEEVMQLFRMGAEDIDFSTPNSITSYFTVNATPSRRFQSVAGWDMFFGYGRSNADATLRAGGFGRAEEGTILENRIPPEADITSPDWFTPLPDEGTVDIEGRVAANRSSGYTYKVELAPGVQSNASNADLWSEVASGEGTEAFEGTLATLDMAEVARAVALYGRSVFDPVTDPTSPDMPEKDAFRVRVTVVDAEGNEGVFQKQFFVRDDPHLLEGFPIDLGSDGAGSPAFADLDGDGGDELVMSTSDGLVHAFRADGSELDGWPVHTDPISLPATGDNAYTRGEIETPVLGAILLGSPAIADLDGPVCPGNGKGGENPPGKAPPRDDDCPGNSAGRGNAVRGRDLEVAVADLEGKVYAWSADGSLRDGFPVSSDRGFSEERGCEEGGVPACDDFLGPDRDQRDAHNSIDHGFNHNPVVADLDPSIDGLEVVAGAGDNHVYAWHADGSAGDGWPVFLRDPDKLAAVHPQTHKLTYAEDAKPFAGSKIVVAPSVGDVDDDGDLEVAAAVNEEYEEPPNASRLRDQLSGTLQGILDIGNGRVYVIDARGSQAPSASADDAGSAHPHPQAYLSGWPAEIATIAAGILPYVGEGPDGAPTLADVDGNGDLEIGVAMHAGPGYIFDHDGRSHFGTDPEGKAITLANTRHEYKSSAKDTPSFVSVGGGSFGELLPGQMTWSAPTGGLIRLLDIALAAQQIGGEDHVSAWDMATGSFFPGFPSVVNDLQFFVIPSIADVSGDGVPEVLEGTAVYDVRAANALGVPVPGWPKFTGGWVVAAAGTGDLDGDRSLDVASVTREGLLFVWGTDGDACQPPQWPKYQHDLANTGNYQSQVAKPASCRARPS